MVSRLKVSETKLNQNNDGQKHVLTHYKRKRDVGSILQKSLMIVVIISFLIDLIVMFDGVTCLLFCKSEAEKCENHWFDLLTLHCWVLFTVYSTCLK